MTFIQKIRETDCVKNYFQNTRLYHCFKTIAHSIIKIASKIWNFVNPGKNDTKVVPVSAASIKPVAPPKPDPIIIPLKPTPSSGLSINPPIPAPTKTLPKSVVKDTEPGLDAANGLRPNDASLLIDQNAVAACKLEKKKLQTSLNELKAKLSLQQAHLDSLEKATPLETKKKIDHENYQLWFVIERNLNAEKNQLSQVEFQNNLSSTPELLAEITLLKEKVGHLETEYAAAKQNVEEMSKTLTPEIFHAEKAIGVTKNAIFETTMAIRACRSRKDALYLPAAKKLAQNITTTKTHFSSDPIVEIEEIKNAMSKLSSEQLEAHWKDHKDRIDNLLKKVQGTGNIRGLGKDAKNCSLLLNNSDLLNDPKIILALFALQVSASKNNAEARQLIEVEGANFTLPGMLEFGFKGVSPLQLESMPVNGFCNQDKVTHLQDYVRRKNIDNTFLPVIKSIHEACDTLKPEGGRTDFQVIPNMGKENEYSINNWKMYAADFKELLSKIDLAIESKNQNKLVENAGKWPLHQLISQSREGMHDLMQSIGIKSSKETNDWDYTIDDVTVEIGFDELVEKICTSTALLDPGVSHNFDRLHWISALLDGKKYLHTIDGQYTGRDVLEKVVERLATNVSEENVIVAEQFYVRTKLALKSVKGV